MFSGISLPFMAKNLPPQTIELIAERFRALGEPVRLQILMALREGERTVSDLVELQGTSQANISKHLQVLTASGFLKRRKQGLNVFYAISDKEIFNMCEAVCGNIRKQAEARAKLLG
ncbi:hypothetical protein AW736_10610 [Termitidicoccus mucosus]|uniref:HTH arsR-type domain-containing protein n=2 Tax=Termitidicoccus mucosus TaxID=1184151 RepID=A0A178IKJ6_9BACT|nr:hypothetical protein AW736_10610 [Opitutaceae bacterium TSB47]